MNTSIGPLTFHKEDLLCFLPVFCFQWLQQAAHSNTWRWSSTSLVSKTAPGNECGQNCQRLVFLALHHLLTPPRFVLRHVLSCVPKTEHVLSFFSL